MKSIHVSKSIDSTNYSKVRLRHLKYTFQLTLPSSSSLLSDIQPTTFQKLTRLKKVLHLHISDSNEPLSLSRHYRRFLVSSSHSIKAITNNSIALDKNIRTLKDIKVLKSIQVDETKPPRPLRVLKNLRDISFTYKSETLRFPTAEDIAKLEAFYKAILKALPRLKRISCDNISNNHLQSLRMAIQARPSGLDEVNLVLKSSVMQYLNFSLEAIQDLITTFSVDIATRRAFSTYITAASSFKNLQSLDLDLFCDSLTNWSVDMLGSLENIPKLKAFKLTASVPLEQYIQQLKLPESLNALILQFRDAYTKVENTTIISPVEKAFERLVELISSLKNLRSLRIEMHPAHDGVHIIFTEAFKQMMRTLPPKIEDLSIIEWYFINRSNTVNAEQLMIPSPQLVKCLSEMKSLKNLSLYMNISLFESPIKYVLEDLRALALTLNVESCSVNEILVTLNPEKLNCLSIWNRGPRLGWISEEDFIDFCENLQEFELIKELKIIGFFLDEVTEGCMNALIEALIGLRYLESCMISIFVKKNYQDQEGMKRLKDVISVKKRLRSAKIKIESSEENRAALQEGFEVSLERCDKGTVVNNNNGGGG